MKLTFPGKDYIFVDETSLTDDKLLNQSKIHLIHLNFKTPTKEKIDAVLTLFNKTNRFVVSDNIKLYNDILKRTAKKYYIMNNTGDPIITFFRRNNKVLLNFNNLNQSEKQFVCSPYVLPDVIKNVEVILLDKTLFEQLKDSFSLWDGNIILTGG